MCMCLYVCVVLNVMVWLESSGGVNWYNLENSITSYCNVSQSGSLNNLGHQVIGSSS